MATKTVSLVLGSGGARGMAHVGVIRYLEENDYDIRSISGCSIGALVGGVYAAGKIDEFTDWLGAMRRRDVLTLMDLSFQRDGLVKGDKIIDRMKDFLGDENIEDLPITYTAVAADIRKGREVWIDSGPLFDAIRASISLPLFFTPFSYNGAQLFDGGLLNPVPVAPTVRDTTDMTIAVNLGGSPGPKIAPPERSEEDADEEDERNVLHRKIAAFIEDVKDGLPSISSPQDLAFYEIAQNSFDTMQSMLARHQLAAYKPDVDIVIARNTCTLLEFNRANELAEIGYDAAESALRS